MLRPLRYFEGVKELRLVPGWICIRITASLPACYYGFCYFLLPFFLYENNFLKAGCFIAAFLTAYSRVYLSQHFLADITAGSILGVAPRRVFLLQYHIGKI